jgi:hypothetical protein
LAPENHREAAMPQRKFLFKTLVYLAIIAVVSPFAWRQYQLGKHIAAGEAFEIAFDKTVAVDPRFRGSDSGPLTSGAVFVDGHLKSDADVPQFFAALEKLRVAYPTWEMFVNVYVPSGWKITGVYYPDGSSGFVREMGLIRQPYPLNRNDKIGD